MTDHCKRCEERLVTVRDVDAEIKAHMAKLDKLWPETERYGCRKVHIVELLTDLRLALMTRADKNATSHISAFERAARKVMGQDPAQVGTRNDYGMPVVPTSQESHAALKERIRRNT